MTTIVEKRREKKLEKGRLVAGQKVFHLLNGNSFVFISGKPGESCLVSTEENAKRANTLKMEDEKKNPLLGGKWFQYLRKDEKTQYRTDDLLSEVAYNEATSAPANKAVLSKIKTAETKREKLNQELDAIQKEILSYNKELISSIKASVKA